MIGSCLGIRDNQKDNLKSQSILSDQYVKLTVKNGEIYKCICLLFVKPLSNKSFNDLGMSNY